MMGISGAIYYTQNATHQNKVEVTRQELRIDSGAPEVGLRFHNLPDILLSFKVIYPHTYTSNEAHVSHSAGLKVNGDTFSHAERLTNKNVIYLRLCLTCLKVDLLFYFLCFYTSLHASNFVTVLFMACH